jgi:hypothetical protein
LKRSIEEKGKRDKIGLMGGDGCTFLKVETYFLSNSPYSMFFE